MGRKNGMCWGRCMCWRNYGGKKVICKKLSLSALSGTLGHLKSEFGKERYVVIFPITRSGRVQKSKKKKKKFYKTFSLAVFLFPVKKKSGKSKWFCFFPKRERENVK